MNIGLFDVDGHNYPNLALMKLAGWHKSKGDNVELGIPLNRYDIAYCSKVFTFTPDLDFEPMADKVFLGGTGYNLTSKLDNEIEHTMPDYSLYGIKDKAIGFLTRGCPRGCGFCIVGEKEGLKSIQVAELSEFWGSEKNIDILDPNLLACRNHIELINSLANSGAWVNINQGLDARLLTDDNINALKNIRFKMVHFAADKIVDFDFICSQIQKFIGATGLEMRKVRVYVLTNFDTTHEEDLHRVYKLREIGADPYVMVYEKENAPKITRDLQRWVNNKFIFRACENDTFENYRR